MAGRDIRELSKVFRTLGEPTRMRIVVLLQDGELNVTQIRKRLRIPQPTVSHHLGILRAVGLVSTRRDGKEIFYSLDSHRRIPSARALKVVLRDGSAVRIGPMLLGLAKR